jgi:hypothetical protein
LRPDVGVAAVCGDGHLYDEFCKRKFYDRQHHEHEEFVPAAKEQALQLQSANNSARNIYIQSATLNGRPLEIPALT